MIVTKAWTFLDRQGRVALLRQGGACGMTAEEIAKMHGANLAMVEAMAEFNGINLAPPVIVLPKGFLKGGPAPLPVAA